MSVSGSRADVREAGAAPRAAGPRQLRVLFFVDRAGFLRQYASLVRLLAERGHEVHLAFGRSPRGGQRRLAERIVAESPRLTSGSAPERDSSDGWRDVAFIVRGLGDLARYAHPRYAHAVALRLRMTDKTFRALAKPRRFEPLGRRLALRVAQRLADTSDAGLAERATRWAARSEEAIPTSSRIDRYIRELAPDVVLATPLVSYASQQVEYLKSARKLGIPAGICVASWDNLTNKGLLKVVPERVFVWNEVQGREAVELHGAPPECVVATGAQPFDDWFELRTSCTREEFARRVGLDPGSPYVAYLCSSPFVTNHSDDEVRFVERWLEALRSSGDRRLQKLGVLVRPHPVGPQWIDVDLARFGNAVVWPAKSHRPFEREVQQGYYDTVAHSAAAAGINTTALIEAAIAGKSVLTVLAPEFAQESTLHFRHLLAENGGFLHVADSLETHLGQLVRVLDESAGDAERRERFVESFVRPHGLGRPATPILADAVEELARLPVRAGARRPLLRLALGLEAGLTSAAALTRRTRSRLSSRPADG